HPSGDGRGRDEPSVRASVKTVAPNPITTERERIPRLVAPARSEVRAPARAMTGVSEGIRESLSPAASSGAYMGQGTGEPQPRSAPTGVTAPAAWVELPYRDREEAGNPQAPAAPSFPRDRSTEERSKGRSREPFMMGETPKPTAQSVTM